MEAGLDHVARLGASAIWLSPIYPSPLADFGYDVSDHTAVDPVYGALEDFDRLVAGAHSRGLRVLMDLVPCHTSIEHPWFTDHPDRGATPTWWKPCRRWCASGAPAEWTAFA
ncbi:MAG: alpha-amylase family glycosyl hydrolase [Thermoleophilaceae bacterium]